MTNDFRRVVFSLGSNLGNRLAALQQAIEIITAQEGVTAIAVSSVYETDPVGGPDQDDYLNAILICQSTLDPQALLDLAHRAETALHRTREIRWGPRTLDVDIIDIEGITSDDPALMLPHPRAVERAFVLVPLLEVSPAHVLTGNATAVADLVTAMPPAEKAGVRNSLDRHLGI